MTQQNNYRLLRSAFEAVCGHNDFDVAMLRRAALIQESFISKRQEHIEFFGGVLMGVQVVRFTDQDRNKIFDQLLEVDEEDLKPVLYSVKNPQGQLSINQTFKVSSDVFNLSCVWLMHGFQTSSKLTPEQKQEAKTRVCSYLIYKFLTSLLFHYFKFPADKEVAMATYDQLSLKFSLKQQGSWSALIWNMASGLVEPGGIYYQIINDMNNDYDVVQMLNGIQGRIKDVVKNIYSVFMQVHKNGKRVKTSSLFHEDENGKMELKDITAGLGVYTQYIKRILPDPNAFVKDELMTVVSKMMPTVSNRLLYNALTWSSEHFRTTEDNIVNQAVDAVLEHAADYLYADRSVGQNDIAHRLERLRGTYTSSRASDPLLIHARKTVEELVKRATNTRNDNAIAAVRTTWMLYLVARAYTMRHYASGFTSKTT